MSNLSPMPAAAQVNKPATATVSTPSAVARNGPAAGVGPSQSTLWQKAVDMLPSPECSAIGFTNIDKLTILEDAKQAALAAQDLRAKNQWKLKWSNKDVLLRDVAGRVVDFIDKFATIGDLAVQYDPGHATLPWAGFRLLLGVSDYIDSWWKAWLKFDIQRPLDCHGRF